MPSAFITENADERVQDNDDDDGGDEDDEEDNLPYHVDPRHVRGGRPRDPTRVDALRSLLRGAGCRRPRGVSRPGVV